MTGLGSFEPSAIQLTLEYLQESARWSGCARVLLVYIYIYSYASTGTLVSDLLSQSTPCGTKMDFSLFIKALQHKW